MSVNKRKQAKALQSLALKLPLTNLAGGMVILAMAYVTSGWGQGVMALFFGIIGALVGVVLFGATQKQIQRAENKWRLKVREVASKIESKLDEEQGGNNKLMDVFEVEYLGGHPGWILKGKVEFGTLEVYEKSLVFKNKANRIKFQLARIKRVGADPEKLVRQNKKFAGAVLPKPLTHKNKLLKRLFDEVQKRRRFIVVDYLNDLGEKNMVLFSATYGNPWIAKAVQASIQEIMKKLPKEKKSKGTTDKLRLTQASDDAIAAAEAASRQTHGGEFDT